MGDLRYALRSLWRSPGFSIVAIITLALGIGANTAIFTLVNALILKPLPFRDPSKLVIAWDTYLPQYPKIGASPAELDLWRQQSDLFEQTGYYRAISFDMSMNSAGSEALEVHAAFVSDGLMPMLGVAPKLGSMSVDGSVLLSDALWRSRFGADPQIAGKTVRLNEKIYSIAGVMAPSFRFPDYADIWIPWNSSLNDELTNPVRHSITFVGRLRNGVGEQQASTRFDALSRRLAAEHPKTSAGWGTRLYLLQDDLTASVRPALLMLLAAVALVLLIACANVANLLLARANSRSKEIAVRAALGAGGWRIARQLLTESLALSAAGGLLGLVIGRVSLDAFSPIDVSLDWTVLAFLFAVSIATGVLFGLAPVAQAMRADTNSVIKSGSVASGKSALRSALVVAEFALTLMLVVGAAILMKSFVRLMQVDPGFRPSGVVTARITFPPSRKPDELFHRLESRVRQLPGVDSFASTTSPPLSTGHGNKSRFDVPGSPLINRDALPSAEARFVSPEYFKAMGIAVRSGRAFDDRDKDGVIINETMARRFWPGRDPVGLKYVTGRVGPESAIVDDRRCRGRRETKHARCGTDVRRIFPGAVPAIRRGAYIGES